MRHLLAFCVRGPIIVFGVPDHDTEVPARPEGVVGEGEVVAGYPASTLHGELFLGLMCLAVRHQWVLIQGIHGLDCVCLLLEKNTRQWKG